MGNLRKTDFGWPEQDMVFGIAKIGFFGGTCPNPNCSTAVCAADVLKGRDMSKKAPGPGPFLAETAQWADAESLPKVLRVARAGGKVVFGGNTPLRSGKEIGRAHV